MERNNKYLELAGISKEKRRLSRQRLLKLDTYGFSYWMEKDFTWEDDMIICEKRDLELDLSEAEVHASTKFGAVYLIEEYMVVVGNYDGFYNRGTFEELFKIYKGIK